MVCRVLQTQEKRIHFHLYLAMLIQVRWGGVTPGQVTVRLVIYWDQQVIKQLEGQVEEEEPPSDIGGEGALVCLDPGGINISVGNISAGNRSASPINGTPVSILGVRYEMPVPAPVVDEQYRGIGNMVTRVLQRPIFLETT